MRKFLGLLLLAGCSAACSSSSPGPSPSPSLFQRECAFELSCSNGAYYYYGEAVTIGTCITSQQLDFAKGPSFPDASLQLLSCAEATSCDGWQGCRSLDHGPAYCAAHVGGSCDGNVEVQCESASSYGDAFDCAAHGLQCAASGSKSGCVDASRTTCDPAAPSHCDGNRQVVCDAGLSLQRSLDCGDVYPGGTCGVVTVGGSATTACVRSGPACQQAGSQCDGNTIVVCETRSNVELRIDCGSILPGSRCTIERGEAVCSPAGNACSADQADRCNGDQLESCINGQFRGVDCQSLGFRTCGAVTFMGTSRAACVN